MADAKNRLSALLSEVARGGEVTITNRGVPVAKLVPVGPSFDREKARHHDQGSRERRPLLSFVLDNSVALAWCFEDEQTPEVLALLDRVAESGATAPMLWPLDVRQGST